MRANLLTEDGVVPIEQAHGPRLVRPHQTRVTDDVGEHDGRQSALRRKVHGSKDSKCVGSLP